MLYERTDRYDRHILELVGHFAAGRQLRLESYEKTVQKGSVSMLHSNWWNLFKATVVAFCPDLNFGWLKPKQHQIAILYHQYIQEQYCNIYPVKGEDSPRPILLPSLDDLRPIDWLMGEPPSKEEVQTAAIELAKAMAYQQMNGKGRI